MSCYRRYKGRSIGRVLHFLEHYCGLYIAERAQIGFRAEAGAAYYPSNLHVFARFTWEEGDVPVFTFVGLNGADYAEAQRRYRAEAVEDGEPRPWEETK